MKRFGVSTSRTAHNTSEGGSPGSENLREHARKKMNGVMNKHNGLIKREKGWIRDRQPPQGVKRSSSSSSKKLSRACGTNQNSIRTQEGMNHDRYIPMKRQSAWVKENSLLQNCSQIVMSNEELAHNASYNSIKRPGALGKEKKYFKE